jgi:hypothetical protein
LATAWDIAKLAAALAEQQIEKGVLIAGAPATHWHTAAHGVDLFQRQVLVNDDLVRRYESWWRFWCGDVLTRPVELPRCFGVTPYHEVTVDLDHEPFVLKLAQVTVEDPSMRTHVCPHRWQGQLCRPRAWDPGGWGGLPPR